MDRIVQFTADYCKRLARPIKVVLKKVALCYVLYIQDLEDVRMMMAALEEVRDAQIEMDMELSPIEECYAFLQRCGVTVAKEEMERVDSLRYSFKKLIAQAVCLMVTW